MTPGLLRVALIGRRDEIVATIEHSDEPRVGVRMTLDLRNAGADEVVFVAWPMPPLSPSRVDIDIIAVGDERVDGHESVSFDLEEHEAKALDLAKVRVPPKMSEEEGVWTRSLRWERIAPGTEYQEWRGRAKIYKAEANDTTYMSTCRICGHLATTRNVPVEEKDCFTCRRVESWRRHRLRLYRAYTKKPSKSSGHRAARIRELKATGRYTQTEIAQLVGVTPQYVSKVLKSWSSSRAQIREQQHDSKPTDSRS